MIRIATPHERASAENRFRIKRDGISGLEEWMPRLQDRMDNPDKEWETQLSDLDRAIISRVEVFSCMLAAALHKEYEQVETDDKSWATFKREHAERVMEIAESLLSQVS